ncbi:MAG: hypothetical protein PHQ50_07660 [Eubacteriales bacterium]|nr:hypothetical protein [Eubacteriales bacterium]
MSAETQKTLANQKNKTKSSVFHKGKGEESGAQNQGTVLGRVKNKKPRYLKK